MSEAREATKKDESGQNETVFSFSFNQAVKLRGETSNITANAGVLLLREIDQRLGITQDIAGQLHDDRQSESTRYPLTELLRIRTYGIALGYARQDDADFLAHDPAFKTAVWDKAGDKVANERLASQPVASRFVAALAQPENLEILHDTLSLPLIRHQQAKDGEGRVKVGVIDIDAWPITTHGKQPGAAYNGYYKDTVYAPFGAFFSVNGDFNSRRLGEGFIGGMLRNGDAGPAEGAKEFITRMAGKAGQLAQTVALRVDAAFASSELLNHMDQLGCRFTSRLPENAALYRLAEPYLARSPGRPPKEGREFAMELKGYRNPKWDKDYRVILVVIDKPDKHGNMPLFPRYFFIVTNWPPESRTPWEMVEHYRDRGTFEDRVGEWNSLGVKLSHDDFFKNEATLLLSLLAFNFLEILRGETESARDPRPSAPYTPEDGGWDQGRLRNVLLKTGAVLIRGGRRLWFDLSEGLMPLWRAVLSRVERWAPVFRPPLSGGHFRPLPAHAFTSYTPRL